MAAGTTSGKLERVSWSDSESEVRNELGFKVS